MLAQKELDTPAFLLGADSMPRYSEVATDMMLEDVIKATQAGRSEYSELCCVCRQARCCCAA